MKNVLTISATITVENTGKTFNTLTDWKCAIGNNNYIGEPDTETYYIDVPGADGFLDGSEAIAGRAIYKSREIDVLFGGKKPREEWDGFISEIRNFIHGKKIRITFSNDPNYFWTGRAYITDFDRSREIGQFHLSIPQADPYKYELKEQRDTITVSSSKMYTVKAGGAAIVPVLNVQNIGSSGLKVTGNGETYTLTSGRNRFPDFTVSDSDTVLTFSGSGTVEIVYRRGSL